MAQKIMIDAGHGGGDPGAVYQGRREKDDTLRLALAVGDLLSQAGYDVQFTRTTDVYQTPYEKARLGNASGADLFVSIHRNSSLKPNQYSGIETLVYDDSNGKADVARSINNRLEALGFRNIGVSERPNLVVLNSTRMPAVLVEAGFINSDRDNEKFDRQFWQIANAIAKGVEDAIGPAGAQTHYRVQTGLFRSRDNAERMTARLQGEGFPAFLTYDDGFFKVLTGSFSSLEEAAQMEQRLRSRGYETLIVSS